MLTHKFPLFARTVPLCTNHIDLGWERLPVMITYDEPKQFGENLVDPASSHMLVSKIKPCMCVYKPLHSETANGSITQLLTM